MFEKGWKTGKRNAIYSRKADIWWNTVAVSADALQSTVILSAIAYKLGIENAGIFSIGYALANLAATIGRYGGRNYQVTDKNAGSMLSDYFCKSDNGFRLVGRRCWIFNVLPAISGIRSI